MLTHYLELRSSTAKRSKIWVRNSLIHCSAPCVWSIGEQLEEQRVENEREGNPLPFHHYPNCSVINLFCIFDQSSYDELKIFPTITTLNEKQEKHLASVRTGQDDKLITREERTVCY